MLLFCCLTEAVFRTVTSLSQGLHCVSCVILIYNWFLFLRRTLALSLSLSRPSFLFPSPPIGSTWYFVMESKTTRINGPNETSTEERLSGRMMLVLFSHSSRDPFYIWPAYIQTRTHTHTHTRNHVHTHTHTHTRITCAHTHCSKHRHTQRITH